MTKQIFQNEDWHLYYHADGDTVDCGEAYVSDTHVDLLIYDEQKTTCGHLLEPAHMVARCDRHYYRVPVAHYFDTVKMDFKRYMGG